MKSLAWILVNKGSRFETSFQKFISPQEANISMDFIGTNIEIYLSYLTKSSSFNKFSPLNNLLCAISSRTRIILSFELETHPNRDSSFSVCFSMNLIWVGMKQALQENTIYVCQPPFEIAFKFKLKVKYIYICLKSN